MSDLFGRTEEFISSGHIGRLGDCEAQLGDALSLLGEWWAQENERRKQEARDAEEGRA